ncbi:MAG TPA: helix-turn-helix domain-containing protein [Flavobacteriales bacterium]|jgi:AcrR family transcriptional regulator|nr:helix-turn-helix domain-containing protein [Flavobacteriales bacterium]
MKATEKRIQILQAAKACFTQYGYDKTTLDDIGKRLGLNKSSLYYYFKNKEEIFTAVVVQETDDILVELQQEMSVHHEPEEKIQLYMRKRLGYYRKVLSLHQLTAESVRQIQPGFHALIHDILQREIAFVSRELMLMDPQLSDAMVKRVAELIISSADAIKHEEVIYNRLSMNDTPDYQRIEKDTELLIRLILHGVRQTVRKHYPEMAE